jgi:hypothetical protein
MTTEATRVARAQRWLARGKVLRTLLVVLIAVAALAFAAAGWGSSGGPMIDAPVPGAEQAAGRSHALVLPPWLSYRGRSLADWQRAYFIWASRIPTDGPQPHPGLAEGDVDCSYAQRGQLWFLELGGVERRCSVPFGKTLYVPVNFWACLPEADLIPFPQCEAEGDGFLDAATFTLTLDGRRLDLGAWRTDTGRFRLRLADQNVWEAFFGFADLGRSTPFSADGVGALMVLGPGEHRIVAGVAIDVDGDGTPDHTSETSYELTVALR